MGKVGFGLFGHPEGLLYTSNGLFKDLQLEEDTYISLPNDAVLKPGEQFAKIGRQRLPDGAELIKVYIYNYAESHNSPRKGALIGSAYVFTSEPTSTLLYNAVSYLHPKLFHLLDERHKFKSSRFELSSTDLINPQTPNLVSGAIRKINKPTDTKDYFVLTDGPLVSHLMSVVQGFMYNPNFANLQHLYVSHNKELLSRMLKGNDKAILSIGHVLNFYNHFSSVNTKLKDLQKQKQDLEKHIQVRKLQAEQEIEQENKKLENEWIQKLKNIESETNQKKQDRVKLINELTKKDNKLNDLKKEIKELESSKLNDLKKEIKELEEKRNELINNINKTNNKQYKSFKSLINAPEYEKQVADFIEKSEKVKGLNKKVKKLNESIEKTTDNVKLFFKIALITILLFFSIGAFIGAKNYHPVKLINSLFNPPAETNNETNEVIENKAELPVLPKEYTLKQFLDLKIDEKKKHKKQIDEYIKRIEKIENKDNFYNRKWNIAELIDVEKFSPDLVLEGIRDQVKPIRTALKNNKVRSDEFDNKYGMMEFEGKFKCDSLESKNKTTYEVLKSYLDLENNIYNDFKDDIKTELYEEGFDDIAQKKIEENYLTVLIYMHFRWMVYKLSGDKIMLISTNENLPDKIKVRVKE